MFSTVKLNRTPKPENEVREVRLDDEIEALCQDTEYPLHDQEKMEVRHLLWQNWEVFKLGRTSLVKQESQSKKNSYMVSNPPKGREAGTN